MRRIRLRVSLMSLDPGFVPGVMLEVAPDLAASWIWQGIAEPAP